MKKDILIKQQDYNLIYFLSYKTGLLKLLFLCIQTEYIQKQINQEPFIFLGIIIFFLFDIFAFYIFSKTEKNLTSINILLLLGVFYNIGLFFINEQEPYIIGLLFCVWFLGVILNVKEKT